MSTAALRVGPFANPMRGFPSAEEPLQQLKALAPIAIDATSPPYNLVPNSANDQTAALQSWLDSINGQRRPGYLPQGTYRYTTLDFTNIFGGLLIFGDGGVSAGAPPGTILLCTQVGAGNGIIMGTNSIGCSFSDIFFMNTAAHTGAVITAATGTQSQLSTFFRCTLYNASTSSITVDLGNAINYLFINCNFVGGQRQVRGHRAGVFSTCNGFIKCRFGTCSNAPILDPGEGWGFWNSTFQQLLNQDAGAIQTQAGGVGAKALTLVGVNFYDSNVLGTGKWIDLSGAQAKGVTIIGGVISNAAVAFDLASAENVCIIGQWWAGVYSTAKIVHTNSGFISGTTDNDRLTFNGAINLIGSANQFLSIRDMPGASTTLAFARSADTVDRYHMENSGRESFGPGGAGALDTFTGRQGTNLWGVETGCAITIGNIADGGGRGYLQMFEQTVIPAAPGADGARLFLKDNGAAKTQLCVKFNTGAEIVLATQV